MAEESHQGRGHAVREVAAGAVVSWTRRIEPDVVRVGQVVVSGDGLVVFREIDEALRDDGFTAVPRQAIGSIEAHPQGDVIARVVGSLALDAVPEARDLPALLGALGADGLVIVHPTDPEVCDVGRVRGVDAQTLALDQVRPCGAAGGLERMPLDELTMVQWGSDYVEAVGLLAVAGGVESHPPHGDGLVEGALVRWRQAVPDAPWRSGFVLRAGTDLVVLQDVDDYRLDGFTAVRRGAMAEVEGEPSLRTRTVLQARGQALGSPPQGEDLAGVLAALADEPLIAIHDPDSTVFFVGAIDAIRDGVIRFSRIRPDGRDGGTVDVPLDEVTMVRWGGAYLAGMWRLSECL